MPTYKVPEWAWRIGRQLRADPPEKNLPARLAELVEALERAEGQQPSLEIKNAHETR